MFKPGDKVICTDPGIYNDELVKNKEYIVTKCDYYNVTSNYYVSLENVESQDFSFTRFQLLSTYNYKKDFQDLLDKD
jgi:hypothetical protein